jgi:hypothetical protein
VDNEDETQRTRLKLHDGATSKGNFARAVLEHETATDALGAAIRDQDPTAAALAAEAALAYFLAAVALFHHMETREHTRADFSRVGAAWYAVRTHQRAHLDLLARATRELQFPVLHKLLAEHRTSLMLAMEGLGPPRSGEELPDASVANPRTRAPET